MKSTKASNSGIQPGRQASEPLAPVGFVGLGNLGRSLAPHILTAGYELRVFDLDPLRASELVNRGARLVNEVEDLGRECSTIILALPGPPEMEEVAPRLFEHMQPDAILVSVSTVSPVLIRTLEDAARRRGLWVVDAPVAGGVPRAREGRITVMVGAERDALERCQPILETFAQRVVHMGPVGTGTVAKLIVNLLWFIQAIALAEGLALAVKSGVPPRRLADVLFSAGYYGVADYDLFNIVRQEDDTTFTLGLSCKDLRLITSLIDEVGGNLSPWAEIARRKFERALKLFGPDAGYLTVMRVVEQEAGVPTPAWTTTTGT